MKMSNRHLVRK